MGTLTGRLLRALACLSLSSVGCAAGAQGAPEPAVVHRDGWILDRFAECASRVWNTQALLSDEVPRLSDADACPASKDALDTVLSRSGLKAVRAGDWMFVYPSAWHTRTLLPREVYPNPAWTEPKVDLRVADWKFDGQRDMTADELNSIAAGVRKAARPPIIADAPLGVESGKPRDTIPLQIYVDVFKPRTATAEAVVAMYGQARGLARLVYGELRDGHYVPLWDSPLFNAALVDYSYHDLDNDGVPEVVLRGRLGRDGWLFTAFTLRGDEITRQSDCEPWFHSMGSDGPYTGGGFVCPITGHNDGEIEYQRRADGALDLVGNVWSNTPKGRRRGPARFTLVGGRYVRDPQKP
jgi:hypothetical protein